MKSFEWRGARGKNMSLWQMAASSSPRPGTSTAWTNQWSVQYISSLLLHLSGMMLPLEQLIQSYFTSMIVWVYTSCCEKGQTIMERWICPAQKQHLGFESARKAKRSENNCGQSKHTLRLDTVHLKVKTMEVDPDRDLNWALYVESDWIFTQDYKRERVKSA